MQNVSSTLYNQHTKLIEDSIKLSDYSKYAAYNTNRNILVNLKINQTYSIGEYVSLIEGIMQILAAVYEVSTTNYTSYDTSNTDTFYIMNNGDDVIMISLINSATMYMEVIFLLMIIL